MVSDKLGAIHFVSTVIGVIAIHMFSEVVIDQHGENQPDVSDMLG